MRSEKLKVMSMIAITLISAALAVVGMAVMLKGNIPDSVSGLVYNLSATKQWWWSVWLSAVAITVMVPLMVALGDWAWLGWLTSVCLIGAAVTPVIRSDTRRMHNICGVAAGILSQLCVVVLCPWWLMCWFVFVPLMAGSMAAFNDSEDLPVVCAGKGVLVAECICAVSLYGALVTAIL